MQDIFWIDPEHRLPPIAWLAIDRDSLRPDERVRLARYEADRLEPKGVLEVVRANERARQANVRMARRRRWGRSEPIDTTEVRLEHPIKAKRGFRRHERAHERGLTRSGFQARAGA